MACASLSSFDDRIALMKSQYSGMNSAPSQSTTPDRRPPPTSTLGKKKSEVRSCKETVGLTRSTHLRRIPEWYQDNEQIRHGYRPVSCSARVSLASWLYLHNESVNIYSHLIPAIGFLLGEWYILEYLHSRYQHVTVADHLIFAFFLLTATVCLGLSATYHTMINHSQRIDALWLRFDLVGIILLTLGDFVSGIYLVFWCEPLQRKIYWSMIFTLGAITIFVLLSPKFRGPRWRTFRLMTIVGTGLSGLAPLGHGIYMFGFVQMLKQSGMPYYLVEGALLGLGAFIYAARIPESLSPGKFDIYGSSHQLFHILVVIATVIHLVGILAAFDYNYNHRICTGR
ncbi:mPR-like GPCR protein [Phialemonium atrogriseum]|uniref:MPR-like GPCR protein n=1 Tax=Phialemonium atrogriseum TaxID=1093897 RepID=A0AAJ0FJL5_9PEZI|nr:mPR-like GPCR protein [Phialemonium atrogriseum]KAK1763230.1 mPR-like GPCR protein [Phialemonium atrogriseum]